MKINIVNKQKNTITSEEYLKDNGKIIFKFETDLVKNFSFTKNQDYILHLNVLPQPFFGEIDEPDVLIIAKNPSYDKNGDEQDTYLYLKNHSDLNSYYEELKKVNFFESWSHNANLSFLNTWNWWNKRVIGGASLKNTNTKVGIINLCAYHSKYFKVEHYENLPFLSEDKIKQIIKKAKIVIFVWEGAIFNSFNDVLSKDKYIVLNQCKNEKYGTNINTIKKIISGKYDSIYGDKSQMLKGYFK